MKQKTICAVLVAAVWALLTCFVWFSPDGELSETERRPLAQFPELTVQTLLNGKFMSEFESYTLDQFPLRDSFRQLKALMHYGPLLQQDNNGIYLADGSAAKQEYPLDLQSVEHALSRFGHVYEKYLQNTDSNIYLAIAPDKGYYLAEPSGHLAMDYEAMFHAFEEGMPWAQMIDLTGSLDSDAYYRTDTHWRQEALLPAAQTICQAMGVAQPQPEDFTAETVEKPFYGVYYGQAALPMQPDDLVVMQSSLLEQCTVYDHETMKSVPVYDWTKLEGKDLYEVFLSGPKSLLTIHNPNGTTGKELIVFRDSFASSMIPLILQDYETVTVVDIRYIQIDMLQMFLQFTGQDVLFLYSTLVLNNAETIK